ncbi:MAG TPA: ABC transporter permease [Candidatus Borkfalkia avicola]|uniref:ABC transporter permease n=1 Tax=Candidatus Borkfalkia avicola TaxID=2838503 RepID=A0A9D2D6S1_9FIRM|nr:ABC transporter permease [Candidatus Borkfalkia avicola]
MKKFKRRSARMNAQHFRVLTRRYFRQIFSSPGTLLPLVLQAPVMLLVLFVAADGAAFANRDLTQSNVILFMLVVMAALSGILNSYREICKERDILAREVFGGLDTTAYALSKFTVLAACGAAQCIVLFGGSLLFIDFCFPTPAAGYPLCLAAMILTDLAMTAIGLFLSALLKKQESAILPVLLLIIVQVVFCDSLIRLDGAAGLIKYITPAAWGTAVFGKACGLNGWSEWFSRPLYGVNPLISLAALAAITALFVLLTAAKLRRTYRHKD